MRRTLPPVARTPGLAASVLIVAAVLAFACVREDSGGRPDRTPPEIAITSGGGGPVEVVGETPMTIGGTASDDRKLRGVTWRNETTGDSGRAHGTESWLVVATLAPGPNLVRVTATDRSGNEATADLIVELDVVPPVIEIDTPTSEPEFEVKVHTLALQGTVSDDILLERVLWENLTIVNRGAAQLMPASGRWQAVVPLASGINEIEVMARDSAGNESRVAARITVTLGGVLGCGRNDEGQLGDGTFDAYGVPLPVVDPVASPEPLWGVTHVSAGERWSVAVRDDGSVWNWGLVLERGAAFLEYVIREAPAPVQDPTDRTGFLRDVVQVSAGTGHALALKSDGTVRAWGQNTSGELGTGASGAPRLPEVVLDPAGLGPLTDIVEVAAGDGFSLARTSAGEVLAWGRNDRGQLGDGTQAGSALPVFVEEESCRCPVWDIVGISAGGGHAIAFLDQGLALAWGDNASGQIGNGTRDPALRAVWVRNPSFGSGLLENVTAVAAGGAHSQAITDDGRIWSWGRNQEGQLGLLDPADRLFPEGIGKGKAYGAVPGTPVKIAAGLAHSAVVLASGAAYSWGDNGHGQLGHGTLASPRLPAPMKDHSDPSGAIQDAFGVSAGHGHTLVRK